jgi:hypothetical protein
MYAPVRIKDNLRATLTDLNFLHAGLQAFHDVEVLTKFDDSVVLAIEMFTKAIKFRDLTNEILEEQP